HCECELRTDADGGAPVSGGDCENQEGARTRSVVWAGAFLFVTGLCFDRPLFGCGEGIAKKRKRQRRCPAFGDFGHARVHQAVTHSWYLRISYEHRSYFSIVGSLQQSVRAFGKGFSYTN